MESFLRKKGCSIIGQFAHLNSDTFLAICYSVYEKGCFVYKVEQQLEGYVVRISKPLNICSSVKHQVEGDELHENKSTLIFCFEFPLAVKFPNEEESQKIIEALRIMTKSDKYSESVELETEKASKVQSQTESQINDFNSMLNSNSIDLEHCSSVMKELNTEITTLSGNTIQEIFDSQRRIDLLVDKISSSIDELNIVESQLLQYSNHLDSISDLAKSLDQKREAETSKDENIEKVRKSIETLLDMTDIDFDQFDVYIDMIIDTRDSLNEFEEGLTKLKSKMFDKNHVFCNVAFVKNVADNFQRYADKMGHKLSKSIIAHCKKIFGSNSLDSLNSQYYVSLNKSLVQFKGSISKLSELSPGVIDMIRNIYIDFIKNKYFENMETVCSNIGIIEDAGIEIKYAESTLLLLRSSLEISDSVIETLESVFIIQSNFDLIKVVVLETFTHGLKVLFDKLDSLTTNLNMKLFIKCALEVFCKAANASSDKSQIYANTLVTQKLIDLTKVVSLSVKEDGKELMESAKDIKASKIEHEHCFEKVTWFVNLIKNLTTLFGKIGITSDESVDETIQFLFPSVLSYINTIASQSDDQVLRYARAIESSDELFRAGYNQISPLMNMMRGRAKSSYDNYINLLLNTVFDMHFEKLKNFFDNIENLLAAGLTEDMIKHQSNCGKNLLQKLFKEYKLKSVKKAFNRMHDSIMKLFSKNDSLIICGKMADYLRDQFHNYNKIIEKCYLEGKDKAIGFEFTDDEVKKMWSDLYT